MGITLLYLFLFLFLALRCTARGGVLHIQVSAGDGGVLAGGRDVLYGQGWRCFVWSETEMSCMAGDGDVSYGRRR
jgi:hypothetical protein